jgi:peptidoglycan/xylan/chitin deacetylase (PgdA/CDA1 family)
LTRHGRPAGHGAHHLDACEVAALYAGHEVAVHMVTHPWPTRLDNTQIAAEVLDDRRALEDLVGYPVRGMAYPFGDYNQRVIEVLRQCGIVYSRTVEASPRCFPPAEPLAWPATGHQFDEKPEPMAVRFSRWYDSGGTGVFFVWGHSFEFDRRNDWQALETIYRPLSGKSDVWYATNLELFDYEAARRSMVIAANRRSAYNPSALAVTLNVDGTLIDAAPGVVTPLSV